MPAAFKRWLKKWYPQDAEMYETYKARRREWMPVRRVVLQMVVMLIGLLVVGIPALTFYDGIDTNWQSVFGIIAIICAAIAAVGGMIVVDLLWDRKCEKPTPSKKDMVALEAHRFVDQEE